MTKRYFITLLIPFAFNSCDDKIIKTSTLSPNQFLERGEWLDSSDTVNGMSIRNNKIAFFRKMNFNADQIREYYIIDSIYSEGETETKKEEYLFITTVPDTLKYHILKRNAKIVVLEDAKGNKHTYKFWR